ncbi:MAG: hypothetical protein AB1546_09960 [bacterium]
MKFFVLSFRLIFIVSLPVQFLLAKTSLYINHITFLTLAAVMILWILFYMYIKNNPSVVRRFVSSRTFVLVHIIFMIVIQYKIFSRTVVPLIFLTFLLVFFSWVYFRLLLNTMPRRTFKFTLLAFCVLVFCIVALILAIHAKKMPWLVILTPSVLVFEILYSLKPHRILAGPYFAALSWIDVLLVFYPFLIKLPVNRWEVIDFYAASVVGSALAFAAILLARRFRTFLFKYAFIIAGFIFFTSSCNILFHNFKPCDYKKIKKDFIVHSKTEGSYDMVLVAEGRYLFSIFGTKDVHVMERIDTTGREETQVYDLPGNSHPQRLVYDPVRNRVAVANWGEPSANLFVFDARSFKVIKSFRTDKFIKGSVNITADPDFRHYYLLEETKGTLIAFDADTIEPIAWGKARGIAYGITYNPVRDSIFTSSWIFPFINELDTENLRLKKTYVSSFVTYELGSDPVTGEVFAAEPLRRRIVVYDGRNFRITRAFRTGFGVRDFQLDRTGNLLIAGSYVEGTLDIFELSTGKRVGRWKPAPFIRGVYYDTASGRIFCACKCGILELRKRW